MRMYKMNNFHLLCKSYLVLFLIFIIGTPILCCTTTDLGIFGVAFVRALHCIYSIQNTVCTVCGQ